VLSATLAQRGVAYRSMGTDLPASALIAAVRRTAPAAILLWSQLPETADPDLLTYLPQPDQLPHLRRRTRLGRHRLYHRSRGSTRSRKPPTRWARWLRRRRAFRQP